MYHEIYYYPNVSGKRAWLKYSFMVLKLRSFLVVVQEAHFVPNFSQVQRDLILPIFECSVIQVSQCIPAFLGNLVHDFAVFPAFDCPVFPVAPLLSSSKHFTWSTKILRYSARPTSCAMSLLLVRFFSSSGDWMYKKRNNYFLPLFRYGMKVEAFIPEAVCNLSLLPLLPKNR